ncbi:MAG: cystathionine beta-lyase [Pseudomonadota bacterium]
MHQIDKKHLNKQTRLIQSGQAHPSLGGIINPPVERASTIVHQTVEELDNPSKKKFTYGIRGTNTSFALRAAITELEGAFDTVLYPSGLNAIKEVILAFCRSGDHILVCDHVYEPTRSFCDQILKNFGVEVEYFDSMNCESLKKKLKANSVLVFLETPGSLTFEIPDITALAKIAKQAGLLSVIDNTWAGGFLFNPIAEGIDISLQALTKYVCGHSDVLMGSAACADQTVFKQLWKHFSLSGTYIGPDDIYLVLRGLRTMAVRLQHHDHSARKIVAYLKQHPIVKSILHPMIEDHPGHQYWKKYFSGANGLFGFTMAKRPRKQLAKMLDHMTLFKMGYSWGGFESLILPTDPYRTASQWSTGIQTMRLHVGLEHPDDLINDLSMGFARL